jgi:3-oxoacyl-[acyl-carrier-protein] synthase III
MPGIGILGVGTFLPPVVRHNDWWPKETVARWMEQRAVARAAAGPPPAAMTPGMVRVIAAMAEQSDDPFQGAVERRVMPDDMTAADMEAAAAEDAIAAAGIDRREIDLLLVHSPIPEYLLGNTASVLHHRLRLGPECLALQVEASSYSFLAQLTLAERMIAGGKARRALLVQSCGASRILDREDPVSTLFGDGASAVVVGRVRDDRGVVESVHRVDGGYPRTLIAAVRGSTWYADGPAVLHSADPASARDVFLQTADRGKEVVGAVLAAAQQEASAVRFFAVHQGTPWLRRVAQEYVGLGHAEAVDTFASTGYLFAVSIPLGLQIAERDGKLAADDLFILFGGGTGMTYGATLMRWGRDR